LPPYIRAKFYADFTTPLSTLHSLPRLLDTLGARPEDIRSEAFALGLRMGRVPLRTPDKRLLERLPAGLRDALQGLATHVSLAQREAFEIGSYFSRLTERHLAVLEMRLGLMSGRPMSYREVAKHFHVAESRAKELENEAIGRLPLSA
jgi:hypothetical protein